MVKKTSPSKQTTSSSNTYVPPKPYKNMVQTTISNFMKPKSISSPISSPTPKPTSSSTPTFKSIISSIKEPEIPKLTPNSPKPLNKSIPNSPTTLSQNKPDNILEHPFNTAPKSPSPSPRRETTPSLSQWDENSQNSPYLNPVPYSFPSKRKSPEGLETQKRKRIESSPIPSKLILSQQEEEEEEEEEEETLKDPTEEKLVHDTIKLLEIGRIDYRDGFHVKGGPVIYPLGYKSIHCYRSIMYNDEYCNYICEIKEKDDKPWFVITCKANNQEFANHDIEQVVLDIVNKTSKSIMDSVDADKWFGLKKKEIKHEIAKLQGYNYITSLFSKEKEEIKLEKKNQPKRGKKKTEDDDLLDFSFEGLNNSSVSKNEDSFDVDKSLELLQELRKEKIARETEKQQHEQFIRENFQMSQESNGKDSVMIFSLVTPEVTKYCVFTTNFEQHLDMELSKMNPTQLVETCLFNKGNRLDAYKIMSESQSESMLTFKVSDLTSLLGKFGYQNKLLKQLDEFSAPDAKFLAFLLKIMENLVDTCVDHTEMFPIFQFLSYSFHDDHFKSLHYDMKSILQKIIRFDQNYWANQYLKLEITFSWLVPYMLSMFAKEYKPFVVTVCKQLLMEEFETMDELELFKLIGDHIRNWRDTDFKQLNIYFKIFEYYVEMPHRFQEQVDHLMGLSKDLSPMNSDCLQLRLNISNMMSNITCK